MTTITTPLDFKFAPSSDGSFAGLGAVFGNVDLVDDVIRPGAFKKSLALHKLNGTWPLILINHAGIPFKTTTANYLIPIGVWDSIEEDSRGLSVKWPLIGLDSDRGKMTKAALDACILNVLSICYRATKIIRGTKASDPNRTIV